MAQTINTNLVSLNAQRNLTTSQSALATSMQRLSSGLRVNSAKDDAAGLAIAERMNSQVRGMNVAIRNANDAISLSQTAEGALGKVGDIFQRMRELAVQSANGTNSDADRLSLNEEFTQLAQEATRTLGGTQFNGQNILAATADATFQIGANNTTDIDRITVTAFDWTANTDITGTLGSAVITGTDVPTAQVTDVASSQAALTSIDAAINAVNSQRAELRCGAEPLRERRVQPDDGRREPGRCPRPHHGCGLRQRNGQPQPRQHPAAGRQRDGRARPTSCRSKCSRSCAKHNKTLGRQAHRFGGGLFRFCGATAVPIWAGKAGLIDRSSGAPAAVIFTTAFRYYFGRTNRPTIHRLPPQFQDTGEPPCPRPSTPTSCRSMRSAT